MILLDYLIYHLRPYYGLSGPIERRPSTPEAPPDLLLDATPWPGPTEEDNQTENERKNTTTTTSSSLNVSLLTTTADAQTTKAHNNSTTS